MSNIKLSHMCHFKTIPYKEINNFRDFYYEDKSNITYFQDWDRILRYHKTTGYDGIELAPWDLTEILGLFGTPDAFTEFAAERGLKVSGMFHGCDDSHIAEKYDEVVDAGKAAVDTLISLGSKHLNVCPGNNYYGVGPLNNDQLKNIAKALDGIGEYAVANGVQIGIHNEFFCDVNKENHRQLIDLTNPNYVFYCLDTAQIALLGDDLLDFYDTYASRICTFHLKDTATIAVPNEVRHDKDVEIRDDGFRWFWEPGEGVLDLEGLWKLVKKHNFKGWCSIEDDGTPDCLASMALSSYYVKEVLGKIYK
ncbi:MAG: sugar phosphate isomerase/epimerase family protein [Suipraeoptans sp.]